MYHKFQKTNKYYGKKPLFKVREISSIRDLFEGSCEMFADKCAFLVKDSHNTPYREITYKTFKENVYSFAGYLTEKDVFDKKVAVIGENSYEWCVCYMAVQCGNGIIVPIDKELPFEDIKHIADFSEVSCIVASEKILKKHPQIAELCPLVVSMDEMKEIYKKPYEIPVNIYPDPNAVSIIIFTSGTTGNAKGVMLTQKNIAFDIMNALALFEMTPNDRFLSVLPIHHTYECTATFLAGIYSGASIAFCEGLLHFASNIKEAQPTMFFVVPLIAEAVLRNIETKIRKAGKEKLVKNAIKVSDFLKKFGIDITGILFKEIKEALGGKLRVMMVGAAAPKPETAMKLKSLGITTIQGYGMTECSPIVAANRISCHDHRSAGLIPPEIDVKIVAADEKGIGEIIVKGDNVTCGYYKNEEATKELLKDGWCYTGDLGYIENNFVYITGRKKEVIITANGENVFPEEVENVLNDCEYIKESMVYAKEDKVLSALIVPDYDVFKEQFGEDFDDEKVEKIIGEKIKEFNKVLPSYKVISKFTIRKEDLIRTTTRKIKRFANL